MAVQISKKRKFVARGIFKAERNEFPTRVNWLKMATLELKSELHQPEQKSSF
ncbi:hypothetical protein HispidOSU_014567 [Sigmodon hispidus]